MPFYEYQCAACGAHHEALQKITERPLRKCPACGKSTLRRLMSAPVFRLKGGGWYETDFKGDKEQQRNIAGDNEPAVSESPAPDKAKDAKPDDKADAKPAKAEGETAGKKADATPPARGKTRSPANRARAKRQRRVRRGPRR